MAALYRERSPIHAVDRISVPVLVLQGLDDKVVPPEQAEVIAAALAANGIPYAYLAVRGRGPRVPRRVRHPAHDRGPAVVPRPGLRVRARRHARAGRPPGLETWAERRPRTRPPAAAHRQRGRDPRLMDISPIELVLGLFVVAVFLAYVARRIGVAYPILLVLGGLVLGFVPGRARRSSSTRTSSSCCSCRRSCSGPATRRRSATSRRTPGRSACWRSVSCCSRRSSSGSWPSRSSRASTSARRSRSGAIVAPPDAVAATAIFRRLGVPRRIVTILEGESLINDATALIAYRFAVVLARRGRLLVRRRPGFAFVFAATVGILVGVVVGLVLTEGWRRTSDPTLEIMISLLAPFAAYLPAEAVGASGVLAAVVAGLIAGRRAARVLSPDGRLMGRGVWDIVIFIINGFAFMLIGLQLPSILDGALTLPTSTVARVRRWSSA